jgi:hypothetical protein
MVFYFTMERIFQIVFTNWIGTSWSIIPINIKIILSRYINDDLMFIQKKKIYSTECHIKNLSYKNDLEGQGYSIYNQLPKEIQQLIDGYIKTIEMRNRMRSYRRKVKNIFKKCIHPSLLLATASIRKKLDSCKEYGTRCIYYGYYSCSGGFKFWYVSPVRLITQHGVDIAYVVEKNLELRLALYKFFHLSEHLNKI